VQCAGLLSKAYMLKAGEGERRHRLSTQSRREARKTGGLGAGKHPICLFLRAMRRSLWGWRDWLALLELRLSGAQILAVLAVRIGAKRRASLGLVWRCRCLRCHDGSLFRKERLIQRLLLSVPFESANIRQKRL
jgi:hypothetical protein